MHWNYFSLAIDLSSSIKSCHEVYVTHGGNDTVQCCRTWLIIIELWPFSHHNLQKNDLFFIFSSKWPPRKSQNVKNEHFYQWILKDNDIYFRKITASWIWGNSFIVKNIGFLHNMLPPQYCVTGPPWVKRTQWYVYNWINHDDTTLATMDIILLQH